jgi:LuxR family maltose regulon positive regulatory protein
MTAPDTAGPLLETKLHAPKLRRGHVGRPRLLERLDRGAESKLTLVSAPPGFGKTSLLAEWLDGRDDARATAWLALDSADSQAAVFWSYVIAAFQSAAPGVGATSLSRLREPQPPPIESVLVTLLNDLSATSKRVVLVLDDYHVIEAQDVQDGIGFLLDHLPPQIRLIIATRADPGLPLARLRARGELAEIRAADLRFTPDEALAYLNNVMGLHLAAADVAALEARTEGWIAALQLAALSMQGRSDAADFIAGFAGDDRYIVDYLAEEVLQRQAAPVRQFLLQTSILHRLSGPLCDAVTGAGNGTVMLDRLDRGNLFLVPLDDRRQWYRYHHLFGDVLRARLGEEQPDHEPDLHRRASAWFEANGEPSEAIDHALAAADVERAADLIERAMPDMRRRRQESAALRWLEALPEQQLERRPVLSVHYGGMLLDRGRLDGVEARLRDAEHRLGTSIEGDDAELRRLPGSIAVYRAAGAHLRGDVTGTMTQAQRAMDLIADDDHLGRGSAAGLLALAQWKLGDLDAAHRSWSEAQASLQQAGHIADVVGCAIALADIRIAQGRLREAMSTYERGLKVATDHGAPLVRGAADMHVGMGELFRERNDLDAALAHLQASTDLGEHAGGRQNPYRWRVAMARIREAEGDLDGALALLDDAERVYVADFYPRVRPIPALKARIWLAQGRLGDALAWARGQGLSLEDDLDYVREFEHVTLARTLLAEAGQAGVDRALAEATAFLDRLRQSADDGGRTGSVIEILVLLAIAYQMRGDGRAALVPLERALTLAEPEAYVRVFLDESRSMAALLEAGMKRGIAPRYARELLALSGRGTNGRSIRQDLIEPLSDRELDVLRLLATDLGGPDIARQLVVSLSTIRSHTKAIYAKLGVNSRRAAVRRGGELGLLGRGNRG